MYHKLFTGQNIMVYTSPKFKLTYILTELHIKMLLTYVLHQVRTFVSTHTNAQGCQNFLLACIKMPASQTNIYGTIAITNTHGLKYTIFQELLPLRDHTRPTCQWDPCMGQKNMNIEYLIPRVLTLAFIPHLMLNPSITETLNKVNYIQRCWKYAMASDRFGPGFR